MALSSCTILYGQAAILSDNPDLTVGRTCVYKPFANELFFDRDPSWGLYDLDGAIIEQGSYSRGPESRLIGQCKHQQIDIDKLQTIDEPHVYFGPLIPHYGHFIISSLSRAWYAAERTGARLLCHSDHPVMAHFRDSYMGKLIEALGISPDRFTLPGKPTIFRSLTIPGPAFIEEKQAHRVFVAPMHKAGDALLARSSADHTNKPIYLSKSKLNAGSVAQITNEIEIEAGLSAHGIDVAYPETLSLAEQISLFAHRRHVIAFGGSALHSHIFSRKPPRITGVALDPWVNANFAMLDKLNEAEARYYHPSGNIEKIDVAGFGVARRIRDVGSFITDLLDVAEISNTMRHRGHTIAPAPKEGSIMVYDENCLPDHKGEDYRTILTRLHDEIQPQAYLEIGTLTGGTLALANAPSISIDPNFQITSSVIGEKPLCLFYQLKSDDFFDRYDPKALLGNPVDLSFLDGMHHCEFLLRDFINAERHASERGVIALHDCLPVEIPMTDRTQNGAPPVAPHRGGWWTGDVWRTVVALEKHRPDLHILCLDASPTGLVIVSGLNPSSRSLSENYDTIVEEMLAMDLELLTVSALMKRLDVKSTDLFSKPGDLFRELKA